MSFHLHRAERADTLAGALAEVLATPLGDPFAAEVVGVPTRGVERWLAQRLSHRLGVGTGADGVCAGVAFPSPRRLVADVLDQALGDEDDPWAPRRSTWPLLSVIDRTRGESWAALLWSYLEGDADRAGRRWWTARHLAGLFASYASTRPAMITGWAAGRDDGPDGQPLPPELAWQAELWRRLRRELDADDPVERLRRAGKLISAEPGRLAVPERLSVFGATRIDPDHLQVLHALSRHRDVHLWLPHPSPALWDGVRARLEQDEEPVRQRALDPTVAIARNRLLGYLGRDSRELQLVLARGVPEAVDRHHAGAAAPPEEPTTLLHRLQSALIADAAPRPPAERPVLAPDDRSLTVHSCHGPDRQVEVLREVLLGLLADDPTLEPRDIIVMCPDIERFAPLIAAAFGLDDDTATAEHPGHRLRVRLADRSLQRLNPLLAVLARLLDLADSRWTASDVVDLAVLEPVARRFGFGEEDRDQLSELVGRAGVRWGLDPEHRAAYGMGAFGQNTWAAGLDRMLLGVAMDEDGQHSIGTALPLDDVDSSLVDLVGRLAELVDRLRRWTVEASRPHPVSTWIQLCRDAVTQLCTPAAGESWQAGHALGELQRLALDDGDPDPPLSLTDVRAMLAEALQGRASRSNFRTGTLTVCTMLPMRSVPHRVVCLLGVDDLVFPRHLRPDGDDIAAREPWVGDRDPRSEDRQLLLDAVLAATERVVVLYGGTDNRTGVERKPAIPIGELLDALEQLATTADPTGSVREALTTRHPLQPFDAANFRADALVPGRFSFDAAALAGVRTSRRRTPGPARRPYAVGMLAPHPHRGLIELDDLVRFYAHPLRALLRTRAGLTSWAGDDELSDRLPVELDSLQRWAIGERMLTDRLRGAELDRLVAAEWRRGLLPPRRFGTQTVTPIADAVAEVAATAARYLEPGDDSASEVDGRDVAVDCDVDGEDVLVSGTVSPLHGDRLVTVTYSSLSAKHRLAAWIRLLALTASHPGRPWQAVSIGRRETSVLGPVPSGFARTVLADLAQLYRSGLREVLPFMPKTSALYADLRRRDRSIQHYRPKLDDSWRWEVDDLWHAYLDTRDLERLLAIERVDHEVRGALGEPHRFGTLARRVFHLMLESEELS